VTAKKKVLHSKGNKNHQLTCKEKKRKRQLTKKAVLSATSRRAVKRMLPYEF
jgi:ribosomal protein L35